MKDDPFLMIDYDFSASLPLFLMNSSTGEVRCPREKLFELVELVSQMRENQWSPSPRNSSDSIYKPPINQARTWNLLSRTLANDEAIPQDERCMSGTKKLRMPITTRERKNGHRGRRHSSLSRQAKDSTIQTVDKVFWELNKFDYGGYLFQSDGSGDLGNTFYIYTLCIH